MSHDLLLLRLGPRFRIGAAALAFLCAAAFEFAAPTQSLAQQVQWIWSGEQAPDRIPQGSCYFRKSFRMLNPEQGQLQVAANDRGEIYLNGAFLGTAEGGERTTRFDLAGKLVAGVNVLAVVVQNTTGSTAGLAAALVVKEADETNWRMLPSGGNWRTSLKLESDWNLVGHDDSHWKKSQVVQVGTRASNASDQAQTDFSSLANSAIDSAVDRSLAPDPMSVEPTGQASPPPPAPADLPSDRREPAAAPPAPNGKSADVGYTIAPEFTVDTVVDDSIGSLIAMEFDEWGRLVCSREKGGLVRIDFQLAPEDPRRIKTLTEAISGCQGILPLNGSIYVTGQGPQGPALYRISDPKNDGSWDQIVPLLQFKGSMGEHGPHAIGLGPDGYLYVVIGNGSGLAAPASRRSPYSKTYEADVLPRVEDPGGHAVGVRAPGGTIVRVRLDGTGAETFAGGLRNAYDLAFDANGELFIHESDMETDVGTPWYRSTAVFHVPAGGELGWRSGWASFGTHQIDCVAPIVETGRGSPTGMVAYNHWAFPRRYHNSLFLGDWSEGRILNVAFKETGGTYTTTTEVFLQSRPLNVTDMSVGPDGALYFCTGGRGTSGGVFRIAWLGEVPAEVRNAATPTLQLLNYPQPNSAWARQALAKAKKQLGEQWPKLLGDAVQDQTLEAGLRIRALDLLALYGPAPRQEMLQALARDPSPLVKARVASMLGTRSRDAAMPTLVAMLADDSSRVRRAVCESLVRIGAQPMLDQIAPSLGSSDRAEAYAARRLLETLPPEQWADAALASRDSRIAIQASLALIIAQPSLENSYRVLARSAELMQGFVTDSDFADLLRVVQLALTQGPVDPAKIPAFVAQMSAEFPSDNGQLNVELAKILAYLQVATLEHRFADYLNDSPDLPGHKLAVAMALQTMGSKLDAVDRLALIRYIEQSLAVQVAGGGYHAYLSSAAEGLCRNITADDVDKVLALGEQCPHAIVAALFLLPEPLTPELIARLIEIDRAPAQRTGAATRKMHAGILALLAGSELPEASEYLRQVWQLDESRRNDVALVLANRPDGDNWAYLVSSLSCLDQDTAGDVLVKLCEVNQRPRDAKYYRQLIELGWRLKGSGAIAAIALLEHWAGEKLTSGDVDWQTGIQAWQEWYHRQFPDESPVVQPENASSTGKWTVSELSAAISAVAPDGDISRGQRLYTTAQCAKCHRFGMSGESMGPDLTSLASRFTRTEVLDAIIHPSKIVSDQYRGKKLVLRNGQTLAGLTTVGMDGRWIVLKSDGERETIAAEDVEDVSDMSHSAMPEGLLDSLSASEIADLVRYLETQAASQIATSPATSESR